MPKNPLAEVFGYPLSNMSSEAVNYRHGRLCPFHNSSGMNCTKSSATDPIGVCTVFEGNKLVVTCPIRFREDFKILSDAADFFFPNKRYVAVTEARLKNRHGKSAGNIDIVIAALNEDGEVFDFGAVEVQAVYITGNVKNGFKKYMQDPAANYGMEWPKKNYPSPDYLSSSRKRLAPQLIYKGGILHKWHKRLAVVVDESFFSQLPKLREASRTTAGIAWMIYGFGHDKRDNRYFLERKDIIYTKFESALATITRPTIGDMDEFIKYLEGRIRKGKTMGVPTPPQLAPDVEPLPDLFETNE
jgi:Restriction endonuclease NotI